MNHNPEGPRPPEPTASESREMIERQVTICRMLDMTPDLDLESLPPKEALTVQIHVTTCRYRVHKVSGLPTNWGNN